MPGPHAWVVSVAVYALTLLATCLGSCYFSAELQGEYVMQTVTAGTQVQYSHVNITAEAIPMWGQCHQRLGDNVILNDSFNGTACIRCFHLKLQSINVLQVHACPTCLDQCYLTEEAARNTCPRPEDFLHNKLKEITLFRTKELGGAPIRKMFCPITGRYTFVYNLFNQTDNRVECSPSLSQLENCADRTLNPQIDVHFQGCSQQYNEMSFECLGDWAGPAGQRFLALRDISLPPSAELRPQYRCALYREDEQRGNVIMAFSSDSTCTTDLYNATYGHMTWNLTTLPSMPWPPVVTASKCSFPYWSQGKWEHLSVSFNALTYQDHNNFNSYTMRCAQALDDDRFIVFSKNGCGEEVYKCIRMKHRSGNVLEFQIGLTTSVFLNGSLCSDSNFLGNVWVTQARLEGLLVSPCPVTGEYSGFIPKQPGLCARLASDPVHPETMYFTVSDCEQQEVYEGSFQSGRYKRQMGEDITKITIDDLTSDSPPQTTEKDSIGVVVTSTTLEIEILSTEKSSPKPNNQQLSQTTNNPLSQTNSSLVTHIPRISVVFSTSPKESLPTSSLLEENPTTAAYAPQKFSIANDSEQVESYVSERTTLPLFMTKVASTMQTYPGAMFPETQRPYRSYTTSRVPPYHWSQPTLPRGGNSYNGSPRQHYWNSGYNANVPQWARGYFNTTNRPSDIYQNWNWEARYRNAGGFPYRPYQNTPNYRQPIALPPIQLPPLWSPPNFSRHRHREEREYQCLGQWEEEGVTYTYTQRKDVGTYECFVGSILSHNEIYIKEAGEHCGRGIDPLRTGMRLQSRVGTRPPEIKLNSNFNPNPNFNQNSNPPLPISTTTSWPTTKRPPLPTRPWKPITAPPRHSGLGRTTLSHGLLLLVLASSLLSV